MYPSYGRQRPSHGQPSPASRQGYAPRPPYQQRQHHQQPQHAQDRYVDDFGDEWSDYSDDEFSQGPPGGKNEQHWGNPAMPVPNVPFGGQPPYPRNYPNEPEDTYLGIDNTVVVQEIGKGILNGPPYQRGPPIAPPSLQRGMQPPPRPVKDLPSAILDDVYEPVTDQMTHGIPQRPPPAVPSPNTSFKMPGRDPPTPTYPTINHSPNASFKDRKNNDSGFESRQNSFDAKHGSHYPSRVGSQGSSSSGPDDQPEFEPPSPRPSIGVPKMNIGMPPFKPKIRKDPPNMPRMPPMAAPSYNPPTPSSEVTSSLVSELSQMRLGRGAISGRNPPSPGYPPTPQQHQQQGERRPSQGLKPDFFGPGMHQQNFPVPKRKMPSYEDTAIKNLPQSNSSNLRSPSKWSVPPPAASPAPQMPPTSQGNTSSSNVVEDQPWFASVTREQATKQIEQSCIEGTFLVRPGRGQNTPFSLTAYANSKFFNLQIRKRSDQQYALGSKKVNERTFSSVCSMMEYYMAAPLILAEGEGSVTLRGPP